MDYLRAIGWRIVYLFRRRPVTLHDYVTRLMRTAFPRRWRPGVAHFHEGRPHGFWSVLFENESYYEDWDGVNVIAKRAFSDGRIVGLKITDIQLRPTNPTPKEG